MTGLSSSCSFCVRTSSSLIYSNFLIASLNLDSRFSSCLIVRDADLMPLWSSRLFSYAKRAGFSTTIKHAPINLWASLVKILSRLIASYSSSSLSLSLSFESSESPSQTKCNVPSSSEDWSSASSSPSSSGSSSIPSLITILPRGKHTLVMSSLSLVSTSTFNKFFAISWILFCERLLKSAKYSSRSVTSRPSSTILS